MTERTTEVATGSRDRKRIWVGSWLSNPTGMPDKLEIDGHTEVMPIAVQGTVRYRLRVAQGGSKARLRISNECNDKDLVIGAMSIGLADDGFDARPGTLKPVTFAGAAGIRVSGGAPSLTDVVDLAVPSLGDLLVSLYLPQAVDMLAFCDQINVAAVNGVDLTRQDKFLPVEPLAARPLLSAIEVLAEGSPKVVAAFGDSITEGVIDPDTWERGWPDVFSRLWSMHGISVVNAGISGNRLLGSTGVFLGRAALARLDQDVFSVSGLSHMVVLLGTNDIGHGGLFENAPMVQPGELVAGYTQIVARAHARNVKVMGATLPPFAGSDVYCEEKETVRQTVNQWIRSSNAFDGVIDFDQALRDPTCPERLRADYDVGDRLHPSFSGYQAMAEAIDIGLFMKRRKRV